MSRNDSVAATKPYFCFIFNDELERPCGHKGCARRVHNKDAARSAAQKQGEGRDGG